MRLLVVFCTFLVLALPVRAAGQEAYSIDISPGRLDGALSSLSRQTGTNIGGTDPAIRRARTSGASGRLTVEQALNRILRGTPFTFREMNSSTYRIVRRPVRSQRPPRPLPPAAVPQPSPQPPPPPPQPIIVTATKLDTRLVEYAGTAHVFDIDRAGSGAAAQGIEGVTDALPTVAQTHLGTGRNKLFIRGIADSSFNGPTQSTIAHYLNDTRLTYSAPNPALRLYDTERVEIIEGPQGSLYGAGSIGGVIRTVTKPADPEDLSGTVWLGGGGTLNGRESYQMAGALNAPLSDNAAVRLLGYNQREGGYIDDSLRELSDIDRVSITGARLSAHWAPEPDWSFDLTALHQRIEMSDGQYSDASLPALSRRNSIAQPFENEFSLLSLTLRKRFGDIRLLSSTGVVDNDLFTRFDATPITLATPAVAFDEDRRIRLISHETRASGQTGNLNWLAGFSYLDQRDRIDQAIGSPADPTPNAATVTEIVEIAGFGEGRYSFGDQWSASLGGRLVHSRLIAEQSLIPDIDLEPTRSQTRFLPTVAVRWSPRTSDAIYMRYQQGYRIGGIAISSGDAPAVSEFEADLIDTFELGIRYAVGSSDQLSIAHSFFYTEWSDVQADIIASTGFPLTTNIGEGTVYGVTLSARWRPADMIAVEFSGFANESEIVEFAPGIVEGEDSRLPNIAELGATGRIDIQRQIGQNRTIRLSIDGKYVGSSNLGIDTFLSLEQGEYFDLGSTLELEGEYWSAELALENILNSRANRFAFGNPFQLSSGNQVTPMRPFTANLNLRFDF